MRGLGLLCGLLVALALSACGEYTSAKAPSGRGNGLDIRVDGDTGCEYLVREVTYSGYGVAVSMIPRLDAHGRPAGCRGIDR